jgi:hypothetical protein
MGTWQRLHRNAACSDMSWTMHRCQIWATGILVVRVLAAPSFATCPFYELILSLVVSFGALHAVDAHWRVVDGRM